mmetsp:Transcript_67295/g.161326  ORF Transcript_67295/g.161326 Transcript_67295/m.161326 type:complete len:226 (-) Transcript_67295:43-720(-)
MGNAECCCTKADGAPYEGKHVQMVPLEVADSQCEDIINTTESLEVEKTLTLDTPSTTHATSDGDGVTTDFMCYPSGLTSNESSPEVTMMSTVPEPGQETEGSESSNGLCRRLSVTLKRTQLQRRVGLQIKNKIGENCLRIMTIHEGGLAHEWNLAHPDLYMKKCDTIYDVNGARHPDAMRRVLEDVREEVLTLSINSFTLIRHSPSERTALHSEKSMRPTFSIKL